MHDICPPALPLFPPQDLYAAQAAATTAKEALSRSETDRVAARERLGRTEAELVALRRRMVELEALLDEVRGGGRGGTGASGEWEGERTLIIHTLTLHRPLRPVPTAWANSSLRRCTAAICSRSSSPPAPPRHGCGRTT